MGAHSLQLLRRHREPLRRRNSDSSHPRMADALAPGARSAFNVTEIIPRRIPAHRLRSSRFHSSGVIRPLGYACSERGVEFYRFDIATLGFLNATNAR